MKNFTFKLLAASLMLLCGVLTIQAHDFVVDGIAYNITNSEEPYTVEVTYKGETVPSSEKYSGSIFIPSSVTYDGITYIVTEIGYCAFLYCTGLTLVEIPEGVTKIGNSAFYGCTGLTSIEIPESVTVIYDAAFRGCTGLTSIEIPNSVTRIGEQAFFDCESLTSIKIPESVTEIGRDAFDGCTGLTSIVIPESVTEIGSEAFSRCTGLTSIKVVEGNPVYDSREDCNAIIETKTNTLIAGCKTTIIPEGVTKIGVDAFRGCTGLTSIVIPESVTVIGAGAFVNCTGLTSIVIPESVTVIGFEAFEGCTGLTSIKIPESVTKIGDFAFCVCTGLTSIEIPEGVTEIGQEAFGYCTGLTSIKIPSSVTKIGDYAFEGCTGLNSITCESANPPTFGDNAFQDVDKSIPIYVPKKSIEEYNNADGWKEFTNIQCIKAEPVEEEIEETITEPQEKSVTITWPIAEGATSYKIVLTKDGETVCTITFSETGEVLTIEYAAPTTKSAELRDAPVTIKGYRYEIKNLERGTQYSYTVTTYGASESVIREDSGTFTTLGGITSTKETADVVAGLKASISILGRTIAVEGVEASDVKVYNTVGQRVSNPVPSAGVYVVVVGSSAVKVMVK